MPKLSVVIPLYNEEESLYELYQQLIHVFEVHQYDAQIIFVDDGSRDRSWSIVTEIAAKDDRVQGIRFRRNFGKAAALDAGFHAASGEIVLSMDADLQDDPEEIPGFLEILDSGFDVVSGWKKIRHDPWHKVFPSRVFNAMVSSLTGVKLHDHNCGMKAYRREIFDEVTLYGEMHRFVPVLAAARGYKVGEKVVAHRARPYGHSKYGLTRFVKGFLDLLTVKFITGYGARPAHALGTIGLILFGVGAVILAYLAARWGISRLPGMNPDSLYYLSGRPAVIYSAAFLLLGGEFLTTGIIAELLLSYHKEENRTVNKEGYSIRERVGKF